MIDIAARLRAAGMSDHEATAKARLHEQCIAALGAARRPEEHGKRGERATFFVPGRIEILGKHTDYAGGRSLLCAVERGFMAVSDARSDRIVRVIDARREETRELALDPELEIPRGDWSAYVASVVRRLARNFSAMRRGATIAFASDLPPASGMSSSSALTIAAFLALDAANALSEDSTYGAAIDSREALAGYLGTMENGQSFRSLAGDVGVGTFGGSQDQTAILCCRGGIVSRYSFAPVRAEGEIAFPPGRVLVVAYSGVAAEKASGAQAFYNEVSLEVRRIVALWNAATGRDDRTLADAVGSAPAAPDEIRRILRAAIPPDFTPQRLLDRFEQFVAEAYDIIPGAGAALARGDLARFGVLVDRSQRGAELLLRNQIPETIALARQARELGAEAASAFGAGFGGSVWALARASDAERLSGAWKDVYRRAFPEGASRAEFIITRPGPGAMRVWGLAC